MQQAPGGPDPGPVAGPAALPAVEDVPGRLAAERRDQPVVDVIGPAAEQGDAARGSYFFGSGTWVAQYAVFP